MYDGNQKVSISINKGTMDWYIANGYNVTKCGEKIDVLARDLPLGSGKKIIAVCDYCGSEYETVYALIINGRKKICKDACCKCNGLKASEASRAERARKTMDRVRDALSVDGYELISTYDDYKTSVDPIQYLCNEHGIVESTPDAILSGHRCFECSYKDRKYSFRIDRSTVKTAIESTNDNRWINEDEYENISTHNIKIRCGCGNEFETSFVNFKYHNVNRCGLCSAKESVGEKIIREYLESNRIGFVQEKRFSDCRDIKALPFDFFLPEYNICIEFDGKHHYEDLPRWTHLSKVSDHDKIKNEYCVLHNIDLIRIPYWDAGNIGSILDNKIKQRQKI